MKPLPVLLLLTSIASAAAQPNQSDAANAAKICKSVESIPVPTVTPRSAQDRNYLLGCDSQDRFDNATNDDQFRDALRCALYNWSVEKQSKPESDSDPELTTLVAIYANGDGVPRNIDLAVHFLCVASANVKNPWFVKNEMDPLIVKIATSKFSPSTSRFDLCSIGLGLDRSREYGCAQAENEERDRRRLEHFESLMAGWTKAQRVAFQEVIHTYSSYAGATAEAEAMSGTGRGMDVLGIEDNVNEQFTKDIDQFEHGSVPAFSHGDYLTADQALNASYRKLLDYMAENQGAVSDPSFARTAERAWLEYRDAFIAFARLRWPSVSEDSWLTFLTKERMSRMWTWG